MGGINEKLSSSSLGLPCQYILGVTTPRGALLGVAHSRMWKVVVVLSQKSKGRLRDRCWLTVSRKENPFYFLKAASY